MERYPVALDHICVAAASPAGVNPLMPRRRFVGHRLELDAASELAGPSSRMMRRANPLMGHKVLETQVFR